MPRSPPWTANWNLDFVPEQTDGTVALTPGDRVMVFQEAFLFDDTIANNARFARSDIGDAEIARLVRDEEAEVIVVCTPVEKVPDHVRQAADACPPGALITDAGSTKEAIAAELATSYDSLSATSESRGNRSSWPQVI